MAEVLNLYFSSIGERLASQIPSFNIEPESYIEPTETTFSMKATAVNVVHKLSLKLSERKAMGLDNNPNKFLEMAANIVAPSLTQVIIKSVSTGLFPTEWKLTRVTPIFKKGKRDDPNSLRPIPLIPTVAEFLEINHIRPALRIFYC